MSVWFVSSFTFWSSFIWSPICGCENVGLAWLVHTLTGHLLICIVCLCLTLRHFISHCGWSLNLWRKLLYRNSCINTSMNTAGTHHNNDCVYHFDKQQLSRGYKLQSMHNSIYWNEVFVYSDHQIKAYSKTIVGLIISILEHLNINNKWQSKYHLNIQQNSKYTARDEYVLSEIIHIKIQDTWRWSCSCLVWLTQYRDIQIF